MVNQVVITFEGDEPTARAARDQMLRLVSSWGEGDAQLVDEPVDRDERSGVVVDPIALASLMLSIPGAVLAVLDLADRVRKRRRAQQLIDQADQLAELGVMVSLDDGGRPVEVRSMTPDQLIELSEGSAS